MFRNNAQCLKNMFLGAGLAVLAVLPHSSFAATTDPFTASLSRHASVSEADAALMIQNVFGVLQDELEAGRPVTIRKFGRFYVQSREARKGRNPRTGASIDIPAKRYPRFASTDGLKDSMNVDEAAGQNDDVRAETQKTESKLKKVSVKDSGSRADVSPASEKKPS